MATSTSWVDVDSSDVSRSFEQKQSSTTSTTSSSGQKPAPLPPMSSTLKSFRPMTPLCEHKPPSSTSSTLKSSGRKSPPLLTSVKPSPDEMTPLLTSVRPPSEEMTSYDKVKNWLKTVQLESELQGSDYCDECPSLCEKPVNVGSVGRCDLERGDVFIDARERGGKDANAEPLGEIKKSPQKAKKKKYKKKKRDVFERLEKTGESVVDLNTTEGVIRLIHAIHPKVVCGHKNCLTTDIVTPKEMGWLWSVEKMAGGIQVSRNWRPGAIPKDVAIVMERTRTDYYKEEAKAIAERKRLFDKTMRMRRKNIFARHMGHVQINHELFGKPKNTQ